MALAIFKFEDPNQKPISRRLGAPKTATLEAWFKEIRKVIPEIPNPKKTDWQITAQTADLNTITFILCNSIGERCSIQVDRKIPHIGV
jgi:hypothetical protein